MASFLQGLQSTVGKPGRKIYENKKTTPKFVGMDVKDKLQAIANYIRTTDREARLRRNTTWYLMALYYSGYQNVDISTNGTSLDVYEREDFYTENQFRRHVDAVVNMLCKAEGDVTPRPASDNPRDLATSRAAGPILEMMKDTIGYDRIQTEKNLFKCLYGNAFIFVDYIVDKKYGTVTAPKYDYRETEGPDGGPMLSKVVTGYDTRNRGSEIGAVCSPLEVHIRPDIKGFENIPYLEWVSRHDYETLNYVYPGLGLSGGGGAAGSDLATQYLEILSNLPGNILGDSMAYGQTAYQNTKAELVRTWIQPCMFGGDSQLESQFPDGVHVVTIDSKIVDFYAENLHDHWTHEVLIKSPGSLLGEGLYDAFLQQDQINEINSLLIQHVRYSTVGHKIYDATVIDPKDIENDPKNGWIPGRPSIDKNIQQAVADIKPGSLASDVGTWLANVKAAMQDMTSAYDPAIGKGIGANTPYSQSVFLSERAQSRWQGSMSFNRPMVVLHNRQLLGICKENWVDMRQRAVADNVGAWTFQQFSQADVSGDVDLVLSNTDMTPRSRAEQIQGLQMLSELTPLLPTMGPKQKLKVEEILGLPPNSNPVSTQIARAYRMIERMKNGEQVAPLQFIDDPMAQVSVFQDFLAGEDGEALDPQTYQQIYLYMQNLMAMSLQQAPPPPQPGAEGPNGPPQAKDKKQPGGQPGQPGGGPGSAQQPPAQSPVATPAPPVAPPAPPPA